MDALPVNITDLAIVAIILISGFFAFVRGFVRELLAVGAWVGAAIATVFGFPYVAPYAKELISVQLFAEMAAGVALFILVLIVLSVLTHWLSRRVRESSLGALDRSLGLLFGLLRGAVLVCLIWIFMLFVWPEKDRPEWIMEARALPLVEQGADFLIKLVPEDMMPEIPSADDKAGEDQANGLDVPLQPDIEGASGSKGDAPAGGTGYKDEERKDMQQLIESAQ